MQAWQLGGVADEMSPSTSSMALHLGASDISIVQSVQAWQLGSGGDETSSKGMDAAALIQQYGSGFAAGATDTALEYYLVRLLHWAWP